MANINFTLVPAKALKDGTNKVRLYISHHSKVKYVPTDIIIRSDQWRNGVVVNHPHASQLNMRLNQMMSGYLSILYSIENPDSYSCEQIADILTSSSRTGNKISDARGKFLERYTSTGRNHTAGLFDFAISLFIQCCGDISLSSVSRSTVEKFHKFLIKKGYSSTTQNMKLNEVRTFIKFCSDEKFVTYKENPFKGYKMPKCRRRDTQITSAEIKRIADIQSNSVTLCAMRDMFMLSFYLGGMNLIDMFSVDLTKDYIRFKRQKVKTRTDHWTTIPILDEAREIINRNIMPDGKLCFGKYDSYLKARYACSNNIESLAEAAGITTPFMFYSARKTFVQIGVRKMIPINILEYCTGETPKNNNPIAAYYVIDKEMATEAMRKIFDALIDNPK